MVHVSNLTAAVVLQQYKIVSLTAVTLSLLLLAVLHAREADEFFSC